MICVWSAPRGDAHHHHHGEKQVSLRFAIGVAQTHIYSGAASEYRDELTGAYSEEPHPGRQFLQQLSSPSINDRSVWSTFWARTEEDDLVFAMPAMT